MTHDTSTLNREWPVYLLSMDEVEVVKLRSQLDTFVGDVFASLKRRDQRDKGGLYLRGLMIEGRRKSISRWAIASVSIISSCSSSFSTSPWKVEPVRRQIAEKAVEAIGPEAWVVDDTGFPKDGPASPGVARQYSGSLGKVGNVQIGVSVHAVTDHASCPLELAAVLT